MDSFLISVETSQKISPEELCTGYFEDLSPAGRHFRGKETCLTWGFGGYFEGLSAREILRARREK